MKSTTRSLLLSAALTACAGFAFAGGSRAGVDASTTNTYGSGYGNISLGDSGYGSASSSTSADVVNSTPLSSNKMTSGDMSVDTQTLGAGSSDLQSSSTTTTSSTYVMGSSGLHLSNSQMHDLARHNALR